MEGIRKENFLGTDKYIVGDSSVDLVLETLGKVYIKIGRQTKVLSDVLSLLDTATSSTNVADTVIIVSGTTELQNLAYPGDGKLIYDSLLQTLYISYNQGYIAIVDVNSTGDYVRKTGDIMSGPLEITSSGSPLIVASSALVKNLNSQYVDSYSADQIAKKAEDEIISGKWTFSKDLILQGNVRAYGNFVTSRNLSSPTFASGFNGYGWMLNADTNTLTIDNLIVRKTMRVFELVVNKISATNGSIWVSNSSKCSTVSVPKIISQASIDATGLSTNDALLTLLAGGGYFIVDADSNKTTVSKTSELSSSQSLNTVSTSFTTYKYMAYVTDPRKLIACSLFNGLSTLYDHNTVNLSQYVNGEYPSGIQELKSCLSIYPLYQSVSNLDETTGLHTYSDTFDLNTNFFTIYDTTTFASTGTGIVGIQPYYKYFAKGDLYIVSTEDDEYPLLKPGDLIRCQKFTGGNMKYYDAIVLNQIDSRIYIIQKSPSVFDQYTEISYNEDGSVSTCTLSYNNTQYDKSQTSYNANTGQVEYNGIDYASGDSYVVTETNRNDSSKLADSVEVGDSLIQMGSLQDTSRQNAVYITSSDDQGPYIDIISGLNRPDYSVIYTQPIFDTVSFICTDASRLHGDSSLLGIRKNYYHQTVVPSKDYIEVYNTGKESNYLSGIITCTNTSTAKNTMVVSNTVSTGNIELTNLRINQGATSTDSPDLAIELTYTAPQNHTIQYMISENSDFSDAIWYTVKDNIHFTASSGNGSKKIYVKLKDLETETTLKYYLTPTPTINSAVAQVNNKYQSNYTKTTKVRLGNLDGIFDAALGNKQPYGFGMYGQNVFLTGEFYLNNGQSIIDFAQNGIKEYYKNAGFTIGDLTDSYGNPTGEVGIIMDANRFVWNITKSDGSVISKAMSLFVDSNGNLNLDIQGWIQSNGLYVKNSNGDVTTSISPDGVFSSINGTLKNITAEDFNFRGGTIGINTGYTGGAPAGNFYTVDENGMSAVNYTDGYTTPSTMLLDNSKLQYTWSGLVTTKSSTSNNAVSVPAEYYIRYGNPRFNDPPVPAYNSPDSLQSGIHLQSCLCAIMNYPTEYDQYAGQVGFIIRNCNVGLYTSVYGAKEYDDTNSFSGNHAIYAAAGNYMGFRFHIRRVKNTTGDTEITNLSTMDNVVFVVRGGGSGTYNVTFQLPDGCESGQMYMIKSYPGAKYFSIQTFPKGTGRDRIWWAGHDPSYATGTISDEKTYMLIYDSLNAMWAMTVSDM